MSKIKKSLLATVALIVGVLTLKKYRNKGSDSESDEAEE